MQKAPDEIGVVDLYRIGGPTSWPAPATTYSFSSLAAIDRCTRQWQLLHASYGDREGFPVRPSAPAVEGQIVHETLEKLFRALALEGMPAVGTEAFTDVIVDLNVVGGIRALMLAHEARLADHPRSAGFRFRRSAAQLANEVIRLFRQQYIPRDIGVRIRRSANAEVASMSLLDALRALKALPELKLRHPALPFLGVIDLVRGDGAETVISDFKTGAPSPSHRRQVMIYAVLWWRATGNLPTRVEIVYPAETVAFTVAAVDLERAEAELTCELASVAEVLDVRPAPARTGAHCRYCDVRQFCDDHWLATTGAESDWVDIEVTIAGAATHSGVAVALADGTAATLVYQPGTACARNLPPPGAAVRMLNVTRREPGVFELTRVAEVFAVAQTANAGKEAAPRSEVPKRPRTR